MVKRTKERRNNPVGTRRRFNIEALLKFRCDVVSKLIQRWVSDVEKMLVFQRCFNVEY